MDYKAHCKFHLISPCNTSVLESENPRIRSYHTLLGGGAELLNSKVFLFSCDKMPEEVYLERQKCTGEFH